VACTAWAIFEAVEWRIEAKMFPLSIAIPTLALVVYQLVHDLFTRPWQAYEGPSYADIRPDKDVEFRIVARRGADAFAWLLGLLLAAWLVGFPAAIGLFCLLYLRYRSKEKWWVAAATAAVVVTVLYLFFDGLLHVLWPEGVLGIG
jgi:hypothetical protein